MMRVEAPAADVMQAVQEVTQDQIIHGTYSYEKEHILYGAHSASEAPAFGPWKGTGTVLYKVANKVLAPRNFKDSGDIGTISIRYVIGQDGGAGTTLRIDSIFVDARNVRHASEGVVESSEYAAIQDHLRNIKVQRQQVRENTEASAAFSSSRTPPPDEVRTSGNWILPSSESTASPVPSSIPDLEKRIDALRHQVELRVKDDGAQLKSAPFRSAATLESVPGQANVVVVVISPYWYGVETEDGHHGWIHHSQLEPLH
jgi:hypothetical protein